MKTKLQGEEMAWVKVMPRMPSQLLFFLIVYKNEGHREKKRCNNFEINLTLDMPLHLDPDSSDKIKKFQKKNHWQS